MTARARLSWPDALVVMTLVGFAATSFLFDRAAALDLVAPDSADPFGRALWAYGRRFDPLVAENPLFLRVMSGISAFVFGPFYLWAARALWRGDARLVVAAPWYAAAMIYSMLVHVIVELRHDVPPPSTLAMLLIYVPYVALPLALPWRARLRARS
jgi:emopamil binding protein